MPAQSLHFRACALLGFGLLGFLPGCLDTQFTPLPGAFDDAQVDAALDAHDVKHDAKKSPVAGNHNTVRKAERTSDVQPRRTKNRCQEDIKKLSNYCCNGAPA